MPVTRRSAPSATDLSVVTTWSRHSMSGSEISRHCRPSLRIFQKPRKKSLQKSRYAPEIRSNSKPYGTAGNSTDSTNPTNSGGTTKHTSCPRRCNSRPTAAQGSISPRLPQLASTILMCDAWPPRQCTLRLSVQRGGPADSLRYHGFARAQSMVRRIPSATSTVRRQPNSRCALVESGMRLGMSS